MYSIHNVLWLLLFHQFQSEIPVFSGQQLLPSQETTVVVMREWLLLFINSHNYKGES